MTGKLPDKRQILDALRERIQEKHESLSASHASTQAGAIHAETRAEDPKDTRATEASYLARGLADRVEELERTAAVLASLELREFASHEPVGVTALIGLDDDEGGESVLFLVPAGGGEKLEVDGTKVQSVTPSSPLGRGILARRLDDDIEIRLPGGTRECRVSWIC